MLGGLVTVSTLVGVGDVVLSFSDAGIGVADDGVDASPARLGAWADTAGAWEVVVPIKVVPQLGNEKSS